MPGIIEGYNYDIFISYRQKDNRHDGWVTEFVENLKGELESTFKEEISVYFDINPHDGLLETHDVDASLKDKLRCLIFIPIISRTYCDPKSFAWEHEFRAFVELASHDRFGLRVKLPNSNVASRVLPIKIYELDEPDIKLCESLLGGVLRGVEFIYKSPGVNRPLRASEDHPQDNLNKTYYRDQINKVANSIREIIGGLSASAGRIEKERASSDTVSESVAKSEKIASISRTDKPRSRNLVPIIISAAILILAAILLYSGFFGKSRLEKLRSSGEKISVVVMPFQNMTGVNGWDIWQEGIQDILINFLSTDFKVKQAESVNSLIHGRGHANYASITPSLAGSFSQKLAADVFIYGNIKKAGNILRLYAQLIDSKTEEVYKSFQIEAPLNEEIIFNLVDSLSVMARNFLIISDLEKEVGIHDRQQVSTSSPEAYKAFINGRNEFVRRDYPAARNYLMKAISIDTSFIHAINVLALSYGNQSNWEQAKKWSLKSYGKIDQMSLQQKINTNRIHASFFETPSQEILYLRQLLEYDEQDPVAYYNLGNAYNKLRQYDKAIPEFEKSLRIYHDWDIKPFWALNYTYLGTAYHKTGQVRKEKKLYLKAEEDFPGDISLIRNQFVLSKSTGDTAEANMYTEKTLNFFKSNSMKDADIVATMASALVDAGSIDEAEVFYREALSLESESPARLNTLAYFLIDNDRNIPEGLELVEKALQINPDHYNNLHTKGLGLYKQGKYREALEILQRSWDLRREVAVYNHEAFLNLEAAKKAAAGVK
jgi:tetratricopeptide (TPR) repeat protein